MVYILTLVYLLVLMDGWIFIGMDYWYLMSIQCIAEFCVAEMDKDIVYNVVKNCKCQIMLRDTVVVRQGEKGDAFYIILHGQVSVFVKEGTKFLWSVRVCQCLRRNEIKLTHSIFILYQWYYIIQLSHSNLYKTWGMFDKFILDTIILFIFHSLIQMHILLSGR